MSAVSFKQVDAGDDHSIAITEDGTLVSWGDDENGQVSNTPTGSGFIQVSAGSDYSVALRKDGTLVSWGDNRYSLISNTPTGSGFKKISSLRYRSAAVHENGYFVFWGEVTGIAYLATYEMISNQISPYIHKDIKPVRNSKGGSHDVSLEEDGTIKSSGDDSKGQVSDTPVGSGFKQVSAGDNHSVAIREDGSLVSWGSDRYNQISNTP